MNKTKDDLSLTSFVARPRLAGVIATAKGFRSFQPGDIESEDWIELRVDLIGVEVEDLLDRCRQWREAGVRVLFTARLQAEGGRWEEDDAARRDLLIRALQDCSLVDVEAASQWSTELVEAARSTPAKLLLSCHDFEKTPPLEQLQALYRRYEKEDVAVKFATRLNRPQDLWVLVDLLRTCSGLPLSVMGMGERGPKSRMILAGLGSFLTYGYVDEATAPGQKSYQELRLGFDSLLSGAGFRG